MHLPDNLEVIIRSPILVLVSALLLGACSSPGEESPPSECAPSCDARECGDDGCGGSCGTCDGTEQCSDGVCSACGNGVLDDGETCDDSADVRCPKRELCESDDACWLASYVGDPATCDARCETTGVADCASGDDCCPTGCTPGNDVDCAPATCGNGVIDDVETCDPPAEPCPDECEPTHACERAEFWGFEEACTLQCKREEITSCSATSDGCCPDECTHDNDPDCDPPVCGDGAVTADETCDDGIPWPEPGSCSPDCDDRRACTIDLMNGSPADCSVACERTSIVQCVAGDDCCPADCGEDEDPDCANVTCGDGIVDGDEGCDSAIAAGEPGSCPEPDAPCDDGDPCTDDSVVGDAADCSARCVNEPRSCADGDGCCPYTCSPAADAECEALELCEDYCFDAQLYCTGAHELYPNEQACEDACDQMPVGRKDDAFGDSIQCRLHHLADARTDPEGHCQHSAEEPIGGCE